MRTTVASGLSFILSCSKCGKEYSSTSINSFATCCERPILVIYHLNEYLPFDILDGDMDSMWRYRPLLPVFDKANIISLHEGMTPLVDLKKLGAIKSISSLLLKDESYNPTGSFKARGISMAVSRAKELSIDKLIIPTAGNAGGALAAYCAKADIECIVVMPEHAPFIFKQECKAYGAEVILVEGLINDCAKKVEEIRRTRNYFDVSTLKEPYRLEGKKTMGYEIAEQLNWQLPDMIFYPAGGGTGLIGIWKAFNEMHELGWIKKPFPKMIAVQSENCAPLAMVSNDPAHWKEYFLPLPSLASGLVVPFPFGMDLMLEVIQSSGGDIITVSEEEIIEGIKEVAQTEGILLSPEGSAAWQGVQRFINEKKITRDNKILFLNTGSGYKYLEDLKEYL